MAFIFLVLLPQNLPGIITSNYYFFSQLYMRQVILGRILSDFKTDLFLFINIKKKQEISPLYKIFFSKCTWKPQLCRENYEELYFHVAFYV